MILITHFSAGEEPGGLCRTPTLTLQPGQKMILSQRRRPSPGPDAGQGAEFVKKEGNPMPRKTLPPEQLAAKKALALTVIDRLRTEYPDAACTLDYDHAWQLLVSVRLAAQCTDARVNVVVEDLFARYPSVEALAAAEPEEIEAIVRPCGLGRSKARDISACMRMLRDQYGGKVPTTFDQLLELPGVGRKSANLIMGDVFGQPAIVTDTHCIRLSNRIGLVDQVKEPQKVEMLLWQIIPPEEGSDLCHRFVLHGRAVCMARSPECSRCCLRDVCRMAQEENK